MLPPPHLKSYLNDLGIQLDVMNTVRLPILRSSNVLSLVGNSDYDAGFGKFFHETCEAGITAVATLLPSSASMLYVEQAFH